MVAQITEIAHAKLNLALHIIGRRHDEYHELDSVVAFARLGDRISISEASEASLTISGPFAASLPPAQDNMITTTIARMSSLYAAQGITVPPLQIHLEKNLPIASGIGGGSANAAAVVRGLIKLLKSDLPKAELHGMLVDIGADVPVCFRQQQCRMQGIGDVIKPIMKPMRSHIILVNPMIHCATADVFKALGLKAGDNHKFSLNVETPSRWRNDLYEPACQVVPEIKQVIDEMSLLPNIGTHRMSGSGATCFGFFPDEQSARLATENLGNAHPNWWVVATELM